MSTEYPYPCRAKGTKIKAVNDVETDMSILGRFWGVASSPTLRYYKIISVNINLNDYEKDSILTHYRNKDNLLNGFIWRWNTDDHGGSHQFSVSYESPPKVVWTKNNLWTVTSKLYGAEVELIPV